MKAGFCTHMQLSRNMGPFSSTPICGYRQNFLNTTSPTLLGGIWLRLIYNGCLNM